MPAFAPEFISDAVLTSDFQTLKAKAAGSQSVTMQHPSFAWSQAEVDAKYAAGLQMWRTPDPNGAACANCHSADAVDLAMIGYDDATIMRRGLMHLTAPQVLTVVDFVHAQRRRFNIKRPCSTQWRPFQPGGVVLAGSTVDEQEASFVDELKKRGLTLATGKVVTLADAHKAWAEMAAIDLRKFPIGIPLPRWTEDAFNGESHRSFDEWVPKLAYKPTDRDQWIAAMDKYLANPTEAGMNELDQAIDLLKTDYNNTPDFKWLYTVFSKYRSVQIGAHFFRMALLGKPGWFERPGDHAAGLKREGSPFEAIGGEFQEFPCVAVGYTGVSCDEILKSMPAAIRPEFADTQPEVDLAFHNLSHHWWSLNQVFNQSMDYNHANYWNENTFPHRAVHQPFFNVFKFVKQTERARAEGLPNGVDLLLDALFFEHRNLDDGYFGGPALEETSVRLKLNAIRMYALLQKELLDGGSSVFLSQKTDILNGTYGMSVWLDGFMNAARDDLPRVQETPALASDASLWSGDTMALLEDVKALMLAANEQYQGGEVQAPGL